MLKSVIITVTGSNETCTERAKDKELSIVEDGPRWVPNGVNIMYR
jgi:hypothetical protein